MNSLAAHYQHTRDAVYLKKWFEIVGDFCRNQKRMEESLPEAERSTKGEDPFRNSKGVKLSWVLANHAMTLTAADRTMNILLSLSCLSKALPDGQEVRDWDEAMRHVQGRTLSGHSGFRLPDRGELQGLYHSPCSKAMHVESDWYWSSTTEPDYPDCAWGVNFSNGEAHCGRKTHDVYVRAVLTQ